MIFHCYADAYVIWQTRGRHCCVICHTLHPSIALFIAAPHLYLTTSLCSLISAINLLSAKTLLPTQMMGKTTLQSCDAKKTIWYIAGQKRVAVCDWWHCCLRATKSCVQVLVLIFFCLEIVLPFFWGFPRRSGFLPQAQSHSELAEGLLIPQMVWLEWEYTHLKFK